MELFDAFWFGVMAAKDALGVAWPALFLVPLTLALGAIALGVRPEPPSDSEPAPPAIAEPPRPTRAPEQAELPLEPAPLRRATAPEVAAVAPEGEPGAPALEPQAAAPEPLPTARPLRERLARTREGLVGRLGALLGGGKVDDALLDELEAVLFTADLGVRTAEALLGEVRSSARGKDASEVRGLLRDAIAKRLSAVEAPPDEPRAAGAGPHVVLVLGVNGSGKTTTIGKLAARHRAAGRTVVLGAGDTFRAAAIEQLQAWGERTGSDVIAAAQGSDPASIAFDTVKAAVARGADVAIIDTAGRLQNKRDLMEELSKIVRVIGRDLAGAPHETLLVLDANTGQNAISQAREFTEVAGVTGLVLTKLDGTAKGGVIVGLAEEFRIPVKHVGVGEGIEDLRDFVAADFVDALFAE